MEVRFKEKPSDTLVQRFCKKIEEFLAPHNLKMKIVLWDRVHGPISTYMNGTHLEDLYLWIDKCTISTPQTKGEVDVRLFELGLDENMSDSKIWVEAHHVQDQLYSYLQRNPGNPQDGDPYWKLWDHNPSK